MNYFSSHTGVSLPTLCEDPYSISPVRFSRISGLLILPNGVAGPTDWTSASGMEAVIDNTVSGNTTGKFFAGQGELQPGEAVEIEVGKNKEVNAGYEYNLPFESPIDSDGIRDVVSALQSDKLSYRFWFVTDSGRTNGGEYGITPHKTRAGVRYSNTDDGIETAVINIQWFADQEPQSVFTGQLLSPSVETATSCSFTLQGAYSGPTAASGLSADDYYYTSTSNVLGYPAGIIIQHNPSTRYGSQTTASANGVAADECFALSSGNIYSLVVGVVMTVVGGSTVMYASDSAAASGGVAVGEVYTLSGSNIYSLGPSGGGIKKRRMA